jgi:hypothetical protein
VVKGVIFLQLTDYFTIASIVASLADGLLILPFHGFCSDRADYCNRNIFSKPSASSPAISRKLLKVAALVNVAIVILPSFKNRFNLLPCVSGFTALYAMTTSISPPSLSSQENLAFLPWEKIYSLQWGSGNGEHFLAG